MSRIVRQSKFRHVFGTAFKLEHTYQDLKVYASAWDSDCIKANRQFFAIAWQAGGGGSLAVIRHQDTGKRTGAEVPVLTGHKAQILDWDFNPFNDYIIASASEDCTVKIWGIPENGLTQSVSTPLVSVDAHNRKVGLVNFHPAASNVLLTSALDFKVKLWDIENTSAPKNSIEFKEYAMSVSWNQDGSQFATTCKDKFLRLVDPRSNSIVAEGPGHQGTKGSRVTWLKNKNKLFTVGFSKLSERQYMVFDPRDISKPLITQDIDVAAGTLMPFYDEDTNMLYIAGKGDGNVRYYEVIDDEPFLYPLSEFKTNSPQRGFTFLPKLAVDTSLCEVSRGYKLENNSVTPIMFQVPRKAETFQEDLYPDTPGPEPALTGAEWFGGETVAPKLVSMRPGSFTQSSAPKLSDFKPKVEYKEEAKLPAKSVDPKTLMAQNDEFRAKIAELEAENAALRKKVQELTNQ